MRLVLIGDNMKVLKKFNNKYVTSFLLLVFIFLLTYYFVFRTCDLKLLWKIIHESDNRFLLVGILMVFANIYLEGASLSILGQSIGLSIGVVRSFCYSCIDLFYCGITPSATGGQPVLAYYMSRDGLSISKSSIVILLYTVIYKVVLLFLGVIVCFGHRDFIMQNRLTFWLFIAGIVINIAIIAACILCMYNRATVKKVVSGFFKLIGALRIIKNPQAKVDNLNKHLEEYHTSAVFIKDHPSVLIKTFIVTMAQRIALFSVGYCVYRSFGLTGASFIDIFALQVVISITVDTLPLPGAVGVSEAMFLLLYTQVYLEQYIAPAMVLTRGINFYFQLIFTGVITVIYHFLMTRPSKCTEGRKI